MPKQLLAKTSRYYRRILYGSAAALTVAILAAALLFGSSSVNQYRERQMPVFVEESEEAQTQVDQLSARLTQFAELYESLWAPRQTDAVPAYLYADKLAADGGVTVTKDDLTATPFMLVSSLTGIENRGQLAMYLRVVRAISSAPTIDARKEGITLDGFIYSTDGKFLAASPAESSNDMDAIRRQGIAAFIHAKTAFVEQLLSSMTPAEARRQRPLWRPAAERFDGKSVSHLIVPMYQGEDRVMTIALSLPDRQFMQYFLSQRYRRPGFFLLSKNGDQNLGDQPTSAREKQLLAQIEANAAQLRQAGSVPMTFHAHGFFFVAQRIGGPQWIAVYAYGWHDVLDNLQQGFVIGTIICLLALAFLWASAIFFDLRVTRPLLNSAEKLIDAQEFAKAIIDTLPIGMGVYAPDRDELVLDNALARRMLGGDNTGDSTRFYRHVLAESEIETAGGARHSFIEVCWQIEGGKNSYIGVASSHTRFEGRPVMLLGLIDINERKANEQLLIEAKQTADEANRAKSMFLAIVSHEIRTPLHGAMGHLELLARSPLDQEQREWTDMIHRSFEALLGLVNDLLDSTKLEANALKISPVPMSPNDVVERCARSFGASIVQGGVAFICVTDPDLDDIVDGDEQRLGQILQNLLSNAAKFTERGTITLSSQRIRPDDEDLWARFEVRDTGIGIPAALQSAIFNPLAQADDSISRRYGGTGLGLFLCRNLSHLMGGRISVRSEPGVGSVFRVELPFRRRATTPSGQRPDLSGLRIDLRCTVPEWRNALLRRLLRWGGTVLPEQGPGRQVDVRVIAESSGIQTARLKADDAARLGLLVLSPRSPLAPQRQGSHVEVSSLTREGLLAGLAELAELSGHVIASAQDTSTRVHDEPVGQDLDILVAEDDAVNRTLIKHQLAALGFRAVRIAVDGAEALEMWIERRADLVITDLGMPRLGGVGLLRKLREFDPEALVVATSASAAAEINADLEQFSDLLQKPISLSDLRRVLRACSATRRQRLHEAEAAPPLPGELDALLREAFRTEWHKERLLIEAALRDRDAEALRRRSHRLQGALMALGFDDLVDALRDLQQMLPQTDWLVTVANYERLLADVDARAD